jgi:formamidopyrimidine-DNA glycosylase
MPELPELHAHAERLTASFSGARLHRVEPLSFTALKTALPPADAAVGEVLDSVTRRGKHLLLRYGRLTYVVHLMQGGRLRPDAKRSRKPRGGVFRWVFDEGPGEPGSGERALLLTEAGTERRAGVWVVDGDPLTAAPLDELGPDADALDATMLQALLSTPSGRLHTVLRDQRVIAGIGRRLANEICHRARLSPFAPAARLDDEQVAAVARAIAECVAEGIAADRARDDMSASRERPSAVHRRAGEPCPVCGDGIRAVEYRDYEVDYCPTCQTNGKVLADNTTSKFLK